MCTGTVLHRADNDRAWRLPAAAVAAAVGAALLWAWHAELVSLGAPTVRYHVRSALTLLVVAGAFAAARAARARTPGWLAWVGRISYSVYLLHVPLIQLLTPVLDRLGALLPWWAEIPAAGAFLALLLGVSWLTYRYGELPGQRLAKGGRAAPAPAAARSGGDRDRHPVVVGQGEPGTKVAVLGDPLEVVRAAPAEQGVRPRRGDQLR